MLLILIFAVLAPPCASIPIDAAHEVATFSANNGFQFVNVVFGHGKEKEALNLMKSLSAINILSKAVKLQNILTQKNLDVEEKFIWLPHRQDMEDKSQLNILIQILDKQPVKNSLWVLDFDFDWKKPCENADLNAFFYTFSCKPMPTWLQVMSVYKVEIPIIKKLTFKAVNNESFVDEQYDLQNMTITSSSLDYNRESILGDCDSITLECWNLSGYYWDIITALESLINITVVVYKEHSNSWGVLPEQHNQTQNMTKWIGVLGNVERRNHHLGSGLWKESIERMPFFDLPLAWFRKEAIFFMPEKGMQDMYFLTRPFTTLAWTAIFLTALAINILKYFGHIAQRNDQVVYSTQCMIISTNIFFLLLHGYYSGALTMFNVKHENVPFKNLEEAIDAYPTWNFLIQKEEFPALTSLMPRKTRALEELLNRVQSNQVDSVINSLQEGFKRVQETKSVLFAPPLAVSQLKNLKSINTLTKMMSLGHSPLVFILGQNSPLFPSFQWGLLKLWESGHTFRIFQNYLVRRNLKHKEEPSAITLEQVALAFFVMGSGILCSLIALLMERYGKLSHNARYKCTDFRKSGRQGSRLI